VKSDADEDGYVLCSFLGNEKITKPKDPMMYFWMEPSLSSWVAAGKHLEKNLSEEDRNSESTDGIPKRYSVPEFDAMKNKMNKSFSVTERMISSFSVWQAEHKPAVTEQDSVQVRNSIFQQLKDSSAIPKIKSSMFVSTSDYFFLTEDLYSVLDAKIVFAGGKAKVTSLKAAESYGDNNTRVIGGFWDVGEIEIELAKPIYLHKVASNGLIEVSSESHEKSDFPRITCGGVAIYQAKFDKRLKDYPTVKDSIASFYLPTPIQQRSVKVLTSLRKMKITNSGGTSLTDVLIYEIDLNQDSIPDVLSIQYKRLGGMEGLNTIWERYVNLNGEWAYVDSNYEEDCT
jgi:hypothetical protein